MLNDLKREFFDNANILTRLIVINVLVFFAMHILDTFFLLFQVSGVFETIDSFLAFPSNWRNFIFQPWSIITYNLVHAGIFHIFFNMLILYWFGKMLIDLMGDKRLLPIFFTGGVFGAGLYMLAYNFFPLFNQAVLASDLRGASAGVFAVVFAMITMSPDRKIQLFFVGAVQLKVIGLLLLGMNLIDTVSSNAGGAFAHLGGALFGYLYVKQLRVGRDLGQWYNYIWSIFVRSTNRSKMKVVYKQTKTTTAKKTYTYDENKVNQILDKISKSGYSSLTDAEKDYLMKASKDK